MSRKRFPRLGAFESKLIREAFISSVLKLDLRRQKENPVMLLVEIGGILTTISFLISIFSAGEESPFFVGFISLWLWLTVLFSNFAEVSVRGTWKSQGSIPQAVQNQRSRQKAYRSIFQCSFHRSAFLRSPER